MYIGVVACLLARSLACSEFIRLLPSTHSSQPPTAWMKVISTAAYNNSEPKHHAIICLFMLDVVLRAWVHTALLCLSPLACSLALPCNSFNSVSDRMLSSRAQPGTKATNTKCPQCNGVSRPYVITTTITLAVRVCVCVCLTRDFCMADRVFAIFARVPVSSTRAKTIATSAVAGER